MRNLGSKLFVVLVAAAIVAGLGYAFMPRPVQVDLVQVSRGNVRVTVDEDGKTRIREKYVVSAPLNGRILRISLEPGDKVDAGKTLLTMIEPRDPELLDSRTVAQAEARVKTADATLRHAEPQLEKARANQEFTASELNRLRKAIQGGGATQAEIENAEMLHRVASEEYRASKVGEEIARFELEQAEAALMHSRPRLDDVAPRKQKEVTDKRPDASSSGGDGAPPEQPQPSEPRQPKDDANGNNGWNFPIYSPITGHVLRRFQESTAVVMPGTPLVELGDPSDLEVEIDVLSRDAVKTKPGDLVLLEHWGGQKPLQGRVRMVEPSGFTKISTLGVEEQRVWVIADLVDPPGQRPTLGDGFRVEARIVIDEAENVLRVPTSALFRDGPNQAVFLVINGVANKKGVTVGRQNGLEAEVTDGLAEGDTIVLHPSDQIDEGTKVKQREK